jgi:hypothetical protein
MKKRFWKFQPIIKHNCPSSHIEFLDETKITDNLKTIQATFYLFYLTQIISRKSLKCENPTETEDDGCKMIIISHKKFWCR